MKYIFDQFVLDADRFESTDSNGSTVDLQPRSLELLELLLSNSLALVDKDSIQKEIWDGRHTSPDAMRTQVRKLRAALGDTAEPHRLIETVRGKGLRFIGKVDMVGEVAANVQDRPRTIEFLGSAAPHAQQTVSTPKTKGRLAFFAIGAAALLTVIGGAYLLGFWETSGGMGSSQQEESDATIAVMPFRDLSSDSGDANLAEGLAVELISSLLQIDGLSVSSSTSTFLLAEEGELAVPAIGQALGVNYVVEGSIQRDGETIRITVQLVDAGTGTLLWNEALNRSSDPESLLRLQDEISSAIVAEILGAIDPVPLDSAVSMRFSDAYGLYVEAEGLVLKRTPEAYAEAIDLLTTAVERDPDFAPAHGALSFAHHEEFCTGDSSAKWRTGR